MEKYCSIGVYKYAFKGDEMIKFFVLHPHTTLEEEPNIKCHIVNNIVELKTLCGIDTTEKLLSHSCNGDAITKEWYEQNLKNDVDGVVCKKCVKKLKSILYKEQITKD